MKNNNEIDLKGLADYIVTKNGIFVDSSAANKKAVNA